MTLEVWTAAFGIRDPDRFDITLLSGKGALAFAPSKAIFGPAIAARKQAEKMRGRAAEMEAREEGSGTVMRRAADVLEEEAWAIYEPKYIAEMRISKGMTPEHPQYGALERLAEENGVKPDKGAWRALLARPRVVLVCFCSREHGLRDRCHRRLLARILAKCGAIDRGELPGPEPVQARLDMSKKLDTPALMHRDLKPVNVELEREELEEIVAGLRVLVEEWRDVA